MDFLCNQEALDLSGEWRLFLTRDPAAVSAYTTIADLCRSGLPEYPATVPGNFELDLSAQGVLPEDLFYGLNMLQLGDWEGAHLWYARAFEAEDRPGHTAELTFEGLDCYATIYLNGELLGCTDNMLIPQILDVTGKLRGENELVVYLRPAMDAARDYPYPHGATTSAIHYEALYVRKAPHMYGWDIMPRAVSAGIWRPVKLRFRPEQRIEYVYMETKVLAADHSHADLQMGFRLRLGETVPRGYELEVTGACGASSFSRKIPVHFEASSAGFPLESPLLWWPYGYGDPNLYQVTVRLRHDGVELDRVDFTHGIRTVRLVHSPSTTPEGNGQFYFLVNGERVFIRGSNWVPADAFHSRDAERLPQILALARECHCNMLRCWGGNVYENDLFYEFCDEAGILVWQDFSMACAVYPQDEAFVARLVAEATAVIRRLRQHACVALWSGDNETDALRGWTKSGVDPNLNILTRQVLLGVLQNEDPRRSYLPSSPYIDPDTYRTGYPLPEEHLWERTISFRTPPYRLTPAQFVSEIGFHACPAPESVRQFISPDQVWPQTNLEWQHHSTEPLPGCWGDIRVLLMSQQICLMFAEPPDNLEDFAFASQAYQAEALKYMVELFRATRWQRSGILWWNVMDGWPQMSDAVVDYYFRKKLAFPALARVQQPLCVSMLDAVEGEMPVVALNDTREDLPLTYQVTDAEGGETLCAGEAVARANEVTELARLPYNAAEQRMYLISWHSAQGEGRNHYLAGDPPFDLVRYRKWLEAAGLPQEARTG